MKKLREIMRGPTFQGFVRFRRIWFLIVFVVTFILVARYMNEGDSLVPGMILSAFVALVIATGISLASIPVIAIIAWKRAKANPDHDAADRIRTSGLRKT
jgi:hypothetical protein